MITEQALEANAGKSGGNHSYDSLIKLHANNIVNPENTNLYKIRNCKVCPLRERKDEVMIKGIWTTMVIPAKCPFYNSQWVDKVSECPVGPKEWHQKMKWWLEMQKHGQIEEQKALIMQNIGNAEMASQMETIQKGHPGYYTADYLERAMKYNSELIRATQTEKIEISHRMITTDEVLEAIRVNGKVIEDEPGKDGTGDEGAQSETDEGAEPDRDSSS